MPKEPNKNSTQAEKDAWNKWVEESRDAIVKNFTVALMPSLEKVSFTLETISSVEERPFKSIDTLRPPTLNSTVANDL